MEWHLKIPGVVLNWFKVKYFGFSGVDDINDVFDGDRRLGDVGRQDDLPNPVARLFEHGRLLLGGQGRVERNKFEFSGFGSENWMIRNLKYYEKCY